jgi:hypothetical protein
MGKGVEVTVLSSGTDGGTADYILVTKQSVGQVVGCSSAGEGSIFVKNASTGALDLAGLPFSDVTGRMRCERATSFCTIAVGDRWFAEAAASAAVAVDAKSDFWVGGGGKTYEGSSLVSVYGAGGGASLPAAVELGAAYTFYFDRAGYVVYTEETGSTARYLMFLAVGAYSPLYDTLSARVLLDDGSEHVVRIGSLTASGATVSVAEAGASAEAALKASVITALDAAAVNPKIYSIR